MTQADPVPVRPGDLLAGKYRVEAVLGMGGMGVVVSARHEQLDQRVAIKFVRPEALGNSDAIERFLREARAAVKLRSEHAARVLDVGTLDSGAPYMVMELLEGSDLARTLEEQGRLSVEQAADWIAQACEALAEAHAAGIVHRDLKPQNLFLARTVGDAVKVKVLDFGVSKSDSALTSGVGGLTRTRAMLGSPLYMSPEQMRSSRDVDARADVWALGAVLFELLTAAHPFEAETLPELCLKVVGDPPRSILDLRPDLPAELVLVIERCLRKSPSERFANAAELAEALEPFVSQASRHNIERARKAIQARGSLRSLPVAASAGRGGSSGDRAVPPTPAAWGSGRAPRRSGRRKLWIAFSTVAVAAAASVAAVALRGREQPVPPPPSVTAAALSAPPEPPQALSAPPPPSLPAPSESSAIVPLKDLPEAHLSLPPAPVAAADAGSAPSPRPAGKPPSAPPRASAKPRVTDDDIPAVR
jgi:serine/threonine-protein kinase